MNFLKYRTCLPRNNYEFMVRTTFLLSAMYCGVLLWAE